MSTLNNKVVFITGSNRGIGKYLVKAALEKGAKKVYAAYRNPATTPDFGDERVHPILLDITDDKQIAQAAATASDVQVLINNAGIFSPGNILEGQPESMHADMNVNYFSTIRMMRAFTPVLEKNRPARIVNIVSIAAFSPLPSIAGYAASKAALLSATHSVRTELAKKDIAVHAVNPGAIDTDMNKGSDWEMPHPEGIARIILDEVEAGKLDIIPDDMGKHMYSEWRDDPAKLAAIFHKIYHQE